jgi:hypothetical protein
MVRYFNRDTNFFALLILNFFCHGYTRIIIARPAVATKYLATKLRKGTQRKKNSQARETLIIVILGPGRFLVFYQLPGLIGVQKMGTDAISCCTGEPPLTCCCPFLSNGRVKSRIVVFLRSNFFCFFIIHLTLFWIFLLSSVTIFLTTTYKTPGQ